MTERELALKEARKTLHKVIHSLYECEFEDAENLLRSVLVIVERERRLENVEKSHAKA